MSTTETRAMSSPTAPTEAELAEWNALTREEQIVRYREYLSHPDCDQVSEDAALVVIRSISHGARNIRPGLFD
jgi:hypothetical protein